MSNAIAFADVKARLIAANLGYLIVWPNQPDDAPDPPAPFMKAEISGGGATPIVLGGDTWEAEGQAWVHVLVPINTGTDVAFPLADAVMAAFRGPPLEPVIYDRISADPGAPAEGDGNYWRMSVVADWRLQTYVARS